MMKEKSTTPEPQEGLLCPSYVCKPGAQLYGIVNAGGFIDYLKSTLEVSEAFIQEAAKGREAEKRFRFAGNCAKSGCNHWQRGEQACGLIEQVVAVWDNPVGETLQECPIRGKCRWFRQRQGQACAQCSEVIRNLEAKALEHVAEFSIGEVTGDG